MIPYAVTLWQPWAQLAVLGAKRIETRSWRTHHRGLLWIHAAAEWTTEGALSAHVAPFRGALGIPSRLAPREILPDYTRRVEGTFRSIPLGAIVGAVVVHDCVQITAKRTRYMAELPHGIGEDGEPSYWSVPPIELSAEDAFGDYRRGRFAWLLSHPIMLPTPVPCRGRQRLWKPSEDVQAAACEQLAEKVGAELSGALAGLYAHATR